MSQLFTTHVAKQSLLLLPVAADAVAVAGFNRVTGLPPIAVGEWAGVSETVAVAETRQLITVGGATPVIAASTIYELKVGNPSQVREGFAKRLDPIRYTSAAVLSGDAAVDRQNVYRGLASTINTRHSKGGLSQTAHEIVTIAYGTQTVNYVIGEVVTGGTSGATGVITADADIGATGTLTIAMTSLTQFVNGESLDGAGGGDGSATAAPVVGVALEITDDAGYYGPDPSERLGVNVVLATSGFTATDVVITTAGVTQSGQGADLQAREGRLNATDENLTSGGEWGFPLGFVAGAEYTLFMVEVHKRINVDAKTDSGGTKTLRYAIWADENAAGFGAFRTALLAL